MVRKTINSNIPLCNIFHQGSIFFHTYGKKYIGRSIYNNLSVYCTIKSMEENTVLYQAVQQKMLNKTV